MLVQPNFTRFVDRCSIVEADFFLAMCDRSQEGCDRAQ